MYNQMIIMKKSYYVYAHYKPNGELFYVGKGTGDRNETPTARSKEWLNEAKDGFTTTIIADNLNNKQAFLIEQSVIRAMNPAGLVNKKIPSDVVEPYWKKEKNIYHVHTSSPLEASIEAIKSQIKKHSLSDYEGYLIQKRPRTLSNSEKKLRTSAKVKLNKIKELKQRLDKATSINLAT